MDIKELLKQKIDLVLKEIGVEGEYSVGFTDDKSHGDLTSNAALALWPKFKIQNSKFKIKESRELAQFTVDKLKVDASLEQVFLEIKVEGPGFINFWLSPKILADYIERINADIDSIFMKVEALRKIMVEYAHPNPLKQFHLGHLRTLLVGESLARLNGVVGNEVFRANYEGDIGPHVAKAIYGAIKLLKNYSTKGPTLEVLGEIDKKNPYEKAEFLQEAYIRGNKDYEKYKEEIDELNKKLYQMVSGHGGNELGVGLELGSESKGMPKQVRHDALESGMTIEELKKTYETTRGWSLEYFDEVYKFFGTKFDKLFFESEVSECGKKIVLENVGKVPHQTEQGAIFENDEGTIIFPGEKYGLHTRVFVTKAGYPTYEGKDMCLAQKQFETFPFDLNIHVVGAEQKEYFKVILKALELIDPRFSGREYHLPIGMVGLTTGKMSSRTGDIISIEDLLGMVKEEVGKLVTEGRIEEDEREETIDKITRAAIAYSYLKVNPTVGFIFDLKKSISLEGDSGPYLLYSYARIRSILRKSKRKAQSAKLEEENFEILIDYDWDLVREMVGFSDVVSEAVGRMAPNLLADWLYDLAREFNNYYQKVAILKGDNEELIESRLVLISSVAKVLKKGLELLDIETVERM
ncbi:MAG: arginine--tRNA ligase [Armatimonadetes bacterium]|nr:MAG: arginine--tRNA ligase [Armatimonadota bacterium]